jgi:hypothetical protein
MQAVTLSYGSQAYVSTQNGFLFSGGQSTNSQNSSLEQSSSRTSNEESVSLSAHGKQLSRNSETQAGSDKNSSQQKLSQEDVKLVTELQKRDKEVRTHEQAHLAAAGQYAAGGASFSFTTGPDGKRYANGGSVPIDLGKEKTPEATIQKMRTVRRAALAPASPSGADRSIAAQASAKEIQAMKEIQTESKTSAPDTSESDDGTMGITNMQRAETPDTKQKKDQQESPQVSDFSRKTMTSAYQAVAALAT